MQAPPKARDEGQIKWPLDCLQERTLCVMVDESLNSNGVRRGTGLRPSPPFSTKPGTQSSPLGIFAIQTYGTLRELEPFRSFLRLIR